MAELTREDFIRWGAIGGALGGKARAKKLSARRRSQIARQAGIASGYAKRQRQAKRNGG